MVQSSRLKKKLHPLILVSIILLLLLLFLYFAYPTFKSRLENSFSNYESHRSSLIEDYNVNAVRIDTLLNAEHGSISQYSQKLNETKELVVKQQTILNSISQLNLHTLQKTKNETQYVTIQSNMKEDSSRLSSASYIEDVVEGKIVAINMYNIIKRYDKCIRTIKEKHDVLECRNIHSQIGEPAKLTKIFEEYSEVLLDEYFIMTKSERVGAINVMVDEHNKMIKSLEKIINQSISL